MAKMSFDYPGDLLKQLDRAGSDELVDKMVNAATPIIKKHLDSELARHTQTGALRKSIKIRKAKKFKHGNAHYGIVTPTGKDAKGVSNGAKLAMLEYGTSRQRPVPIVSTAVKRAESEVIAAVQEVYDREVGK